MKKDIHPTNYRDVIFHDISSGEKFLIGSTAQTDKTEQWTDGNEYPLVEIEISSASHPFYTGNEKIMDSGGRVDKFKKRMEAASAKPAKKTTSIVEQAQEKVAEVTEEANAAATEVVEEVQETASDVAESVTEKVEEVVEAVTGNDEDKKDEA